jgi:hypothetical protein
MPSLRELQQAFVSAVLSGDGRCMRGLVQEAGFSTTERLRIYENNARLGFLAAMRASFPVLAQLGGDDWFESATLRYQREHPSRCGDLQYVGDRFAPFLVADLAGSGHEWLAEMARLEWAYQEVMVAADSAPLRAEALQGLAGAVDLDVQLLPRSELRLVVSTLPLLGIWKAHQPGAAFTPPALDSGGDAVLLLRRADHVELRALPPPVATLLRAMLDGRSLTAALQALAALHPSADAGACLHRLFTLEALAGFRTLPVPASHQENPA